MEPDRAERLGGDPVGAAIDPLQLGLVLSGGDTFQGTLFYNVYQGLADVLFMNHMGYQAMVVGQHGAQSTLDNALTDLSEFGITRARAIALIQEVAHAIEQWPLHFAQHGVCAADMEQLAASIDRDALKDQREAFC